MCTSTKHPFYIIHYPTHLHEHIHLATEEDFVLVDYSNPKEPREIAKLFSFGDNAVAMASSSPDLDTIVTVANKLEEVTDLVHRVGWLLLRTPQAVQHLEAIQKRFPFLVVKDASGVSGTEAMILHSFRVRMAMTEISGDYGKKSGIGYPLRHGKRLITADAPDLWFIAGQPVPNPKILSLGFIRFEYIDITNRIVTIASTRERMVYLQSHWCCGTLSPTKIIDRSGWVLLPKWVEDLFEAHRKLPDASRIVAKLEETTAGLAEKADFINRLLPMTVSDRRDRVMESAMGYASVRTTVPEPAVRKAPVPEPAVRKHDISCYITPFWIDETLMLSVSDAQLHQLLYDIAGHQKAIATTLAERIEDLAKLQRTVDDFNNRFPVNG